jgi:hypothetical protein
MKLESSELCILAPSLRETVTVTGYSMMSKTQQAMLGRPGSSNFVTSLEGITGGGS